MNCDSCLWKQKAKELEKREDEGEDEEDSDRLVWMGVWP